MNSVYQFGFWFGVITGTVLFGVGIFALFDGTVPSGGAFGISALFFGTAYFLPPAFEERFEEPLVLIAVEDGANAE